MIKVSANTVGDVVSIQFESNNIVQDQDTLDLIGEAIVNSKYQRRGGYDKTNNNVMRISVLVPVKGGV